MKLFDNLSAAFGRGGNSAPEPSAEPEETTGLDAQLNELLAQRQRLLAQLGASLYEATKNDPAFTTGREAVYAGIARVDAQRAQIRDEIARREAEKVAAAAAADGSRTVRCPSCGTAVPVAYQFCFACGKPMNPPAADAGAPRTASPLAAVSPKAGPLPMVCATCGMPMNMGDLFCMNCGTRVSGQVASAPAAGSARAVRQPLRQGNGGFASEPQAAAEPGDEQATAISRPAEDTAVQVAADPELASPEIDVLPAALENVLTYGYETTTAQGETEEPAGEAARDTQDGTGSSSQPLPVEQQGICPNCGRPTEASDRFCMYCGHKIG